MYHTVAALWCHSDVIYREGHMHSEILLLLHIYVADGNHSWVVAKPCLIIKNTCHHDSCIAWDTLKLRSSHFLSMRDVVFQMVRPCLTMHREKTCLVQLFIQDRSQNISHLENELLKYILRLKWLIYSANFTSWVYKPHWWKVLTSSYRKSGPWP